MEEKKETTEKAHESDLEANKLMGILAYFLFFLPFIFSPNSKFARFHANQSLILLILWVVSWLGGIIIPFVGAMISFFVGIGVVILWFMGIINAAKGEMKPLPIVGKYTFIK